MVFVMQGQRANSLLYVDECNNFVYTRDKKKNSVWYMKCSHTSCPGTAKMTEMPEDVTEADFSAFTMIQSKPHNHGPEEHVREVVDLKKKILHICATESRDMHDIFKKECAKVPPEVAGKLEWTKFYYTMRNTRRKQLPPIPTSLSGLDLAIRGVMTRFGTVDGQSFYHAIVEANGKMSCMFVTQQLLSVLRASAMWHIDGTFKTVPRHPPARQLVTIMANDGDKAYPVVYVIMESKEKTSYKAVLELLKTEFQLTPPVVMSDYEASLRAAIVEVYPSTTLKGCWFHFAQAIVKYVSTHGLKRALTDNRAFGNIIKMLIALALLPADEMETGFAHVKRTADSLGLTEMLEPVMQYFRSHWMDGIRPQNFSVNGSSVRTNNNQESYHAQLLRCLGKSHPGIWQFIDALISMASTAIRDQQRVMEGAGVAFGRNGKWAFHERTITKKLRDLARGAINVPRFLNYSVRFFHLEGVSNYIDEEFDNEWNEDAFNEGVDDDEDDDDDFHTPPGNWFSRPHIVPEGLKVDPTFTETQLEAISSLDGNEGVSQATDSEPTCVYCLTNTVTRFASPCGHRQLCRSCVETLLATRSTYEGSDVPKPITCAQCRALVSCFVRLY